MNYRNEGISSQQFDVCSAWNRECFHWKLYCSSASVYIYMSSVLEVWRT